MAESNQVASKGSVARAMQALESRNIVTHLFDTEVEAKEKLIQMVPRGSEVYVNSSATLDSIGYSEFMRGNPQYTNLREGYMAETDPAKKEELHRRSTIADYFVGSVQAIAETGEVFVASASGSQLAPYVFGAGQVIWVAGTQKIVPTFEEAMERTRGYTLERHRRWLTDQGRAPAPIGKLGIIEHEGQRGRITLILINKSLGW